MSESGSRVDSTILMNFTVALISLVVVVVSIKNFLHGFMESDDNLVDIAVILIFSMLVVYNADRIWKKLNASINREEETEVPEVSESVIKPSEEFLESDPRLGLNRILGREVFKEGVNSSETGRDSELSPKTQSLPEIAPREETELEGALADVDLNTSITSVEGVPIFELLEKAQELKREEKNEEALELAEKAMIGMAIAAQSGEGKVLDTYVIEVCIILGKMGEVDEEIRTIEEYLSLNLPPPRMDVRMDLLKRLSRAKMISAGKSGDEDSVDKYREEWKRLIQEHKDAVAEYSKIGEKSSLTGRSEATGSRYFKKKRPKYLPTEKILASPNFFTIDFETANRDRASACSVAVIEVKNGEVISEYHSLIKPPDELNFFEFTHIHGLTERDVLNSPTWREVGGSIRKVVGDSVVYAHNASFDRSVWKALDEHYSMTTVSDQVFCSMEVAKKHLLGLTDYRLPTVLKAVAPDFELKHHDAVSDAEGVAEIILGVRGVTQRI